MGNLSTPKGMNLGKLVEQYGSEEQCRTALEALRWPAGIVCPKCERKGASWLAKRRQHECNDRSCGYQFMVRAGTVLQDSKLPLWKWFMATFLMCESKKGISANQLRRMIGSTYRTSWFLSQRIREAMSAAANTEPLTGTVEMDETYIGGKRRFRKHGKRGWDRKSKTMVLGAVERGGDIRLAVEHRNAGMGPFYQFATKHIDDKAPAIYTDDHSGYAVFGDADTKHESVNHSAEEWVRGDVHTNTIESAWSLFKRSIVGSYHHLNVKYMDKYLDEFEWRYNNRHNEFLFRDTMKALVGADTMTYKALTSRSA